MPDESTDVRTGCLTDEDVAELVSGFAPSARRRALEEHLGRCEACARLAAAAAEVHTPLAGPLLGEADELPAGSRVGRYEIVTRIGAGGMGTVYAAHDPALDRLVALKVIRAALAGPDIDARTVREAKAMARLTLPEVIVVHDAGRDGARLFVAMELVDGGTLRSWQGEHRGWREILGVYLHAGRGLAGAHAAGIVHRDFKPDNVLVGKDGRVRVTDFGLARAATAGPEESSVPIHPHRAGDSSLTRSGALLGTPRYMAPETLEGAPADQRSDLYSYCVSLYEALYGALPFAGASVVAQLAEKRADRVQAAPPGRRVPRGLRGALLVGLRARPEERFASMEALLRALGSVARGPRRSRLAFAGAIALVAIASVTAMRLRSEPRRASTGNDTVSVAVTALAGDSALLACPIFETRGVDEVAVRLGAAAATLACTRAQWALGGGDDRVLTPAALLDLPRHPVNDLADPYAAPEQRARTVLAARAQAAAYVDGKVSYAAGAWTVAITVRAPDERAIARSDGNGATFLGATHDALARLWGPPLAARAIDPRIARWTGFPDANAGLFATDVAYLDVTEPCKELDGRRLGSAAATLAKMCELAGAPPAFDGGPPTLDESSLATIVTSVDALAGWEIPIAPADAQRLAAKLEAAHGAESFPFGRARLAYTAGLLRSLVNDREGASRALLLSLEDDPRHYPTWELLLGVAADTTAPMALASAWLPSEPRFIHAAASRRGDDLAARLRGARLGYLLEPGLVQALRLGRALAESGREDEARALAAAPTPSADANRVAAPFVLAFVDLHAAKIGAAIVRLEESENVGLVDLIVAAEVAGRSQEMASRWAARFLGAPDESAGATARGYDTTILLCMRAGALAARCLDRVERLGRGGMNWWYEGGGALLEGARRYARGDWRGASAAWRPLVAATDVEIARALPTEAFEKGGEPELAARLDARKMAFTFVAGVSDAAPREAQRAVARGDTARATALARSVIAAWEVADVSVPAVPTMRALLRSAAASK